jgi:hypothetical protein
MRSDENILGFTLHYCINPIPSVLPLPVGTGRPRPSLSKKGFILTMKLWKMKKSRDSDHEIMNLVEKNVGTPAILGRALHTVPVYQSH